jgi:hypothetical protein
MRFKHELGPHYKVTKLFIGFKVVLFERQPLETSILSLIYFFVVIIIIII